MKVILLAFSLALLSEITALAINKVEIPVRDIDSHVFKTPSQENSVPSGVIDNPDTKVYHRNNRMTIDSDSLFDPVFQGSHQTEEDHKQEVDYEKKEHRRQKRGFFKKIKNGVKKIGKSIGRAFKDLGRHGSGSVGVQIPLGR